MIFLYKILNSKAKVNEPLLERRMMYSFCLRSNECRFYFWLDFVNCYLIGIYSYWYTGVLRKKLTAFEVWTFFVQIRWLQMFPKAFWALDTNLNSKYWQWRIQYVGWIFININQIYLIAILDPPFWFLLNLNKDL